MNSVTLIKESGHDVPKELVAAITAEYKSGFGYAAVANGKIVYESSPGEAEASGLEALAELFRDHTTFFHFAHSINPLPIEEVQPHVLLRADPVDENDPGLPLVVAFIEGNFEAYDRPGTPYSGAYYCAEKLKSKMLKLYRANGKDMGELVADIDNEDQVTMKELVAFIPDEGSIVFLMSTGDIFPLATPGRVHKAEWGESYGSTKATPTEAPAPTAVPLSMAERAKAAMAGKASNAPPPPPPAAKPAGAPPPPPAPGHTAAPPPPKPAAAPPPPPPAAVVLDTSKPQPILAKTKDGKGYLESTGIVEYPPWAKDTATKKQLEGWYKARCGYLPVNWKQYPGVPVVGKGTAKSFQELAGTKPPPVAAAPAKDTTTKHLPEGVRELTPLPVLTPSMRQGINDVFFTGHNFEKIMDPAAMVEKEKGKAPSIAHQLGKTGIRDFFGFPFELRVKWSKEFPEATAVIWGDMIHYALTMETSLGVLNQRIEELNKKVTPPPASAAAAATETHVLAKEELKPAATGSRPPPPMPAASGRRKVA